MSALADRLFNCPAGLQCGPCRRRIGELAAAIEDERARHRAELAELVSRLEAVEKERDEALRAGLGREPNDEGGPGKEVRYWLTAKLNAAVRHLRDIEDYHRLCGGTPDSFNMIRADRARSLYEQITEDFINGKRGVPTLKEERDRLAASLERIANAEHQMHPVAGYIYPDKIERWAREALNPGDGE